jgi:uroporphyrinogen decarboxylase
MKSKERVMDAVNHRKTDRIPITFDAEKEVYSALYSYLGVNTKEVLFDMLNVDTWMILPERFSPLPVSGTNQKQSIWGFRTIEAHYSAGGIYDEICYYPLAGKDEIADLKNWNAPVADDMDFSHFPEEAQRHGDRAIIGVFTHGPYFIATDLRSMQTVMMDFALNKKYAHALIEKISNSVFMYLDRMLEQFSDGIDIVYMADDYCSQQAPLFSPEMFREFVMPYLRVIVEKVHRHGKKFLLHCCGAVGPLLPMIIEAGVDMLEPIQIRANGMDPAGLKRDFGKDLCFYGGVDLQQILCQGTIQQVQDEVKRLIDILGADGGYILGPGHTYIQVDAPISNILAMYETAADYRG